MSTAKNTRPMKLAAVPTTDRHADEEQILRSCRFCSSDLVQCAAHDSGTHGVRCRQCGAEGPSAKTAAEACRLWNARIPGEVTTAFAILAEESHQLYALVSSAKHAMSGGNKFTAFELLEMAEDMIGDAKNHQIVGGFLGVDTERDYPFDD